MKLDRIALTLGLLGVANGAPYVAGRTLGRRRAPPLDGGLRFIDAQPLFGVSKTATGLAASVAATTVIAAFLGWPPSKSAPLAGLAMAGDLLSSFIKRRLRRAPGARSPRLDYLPEAILPTLYGVYARDLTPAEAAVVVTLFYAALELGAPLRAALAPAPSPMRPAQILTKRCNTASGGQLNRAGTIDEPAPVLV
jgi:hypothetical protein